MLAVQAPLSQPFPGNEPISADKLSVIDDYRPCLVGNLGGELKLPPGTIDTHVHVFDPRLGPYHPNRAYTPDEANLESLNAFSASISTTGLPETFVLVQPSPYGTDNRVLLAVLQQLRLCGKRARGIAVVDIETITDSELSHLHTQGIRGLRLNLQAHGTKPDVLQLRLKVQAAASRIQHLRGWMLQLFVPAFVWDELYPTILSLPAPVIADHLGGLQGPSRLPDTPNSLRQPGFASLLSLARAGKVIIKISALYRSSSRSTTGYDDLASIIKEISEEVPDGLIWGSDWSHTGEGKNRFGKNLDNVEPFRTIDNMMILKNLSQWISNHDRWMAIMRFNAEKRFL